MQKTVEFLNGSLCNSFAELETKEAFVSHNKESQSQSSESEAFCIVVSYF